MGAIASVFVDFVARTAGFQAGVQQAAASVKQAGQQMQESNEASSKAADKMASGMIRGFMQIAIGAHILTAVRSEIKDVIQNIDKIPNVRPETVQSVKDLRDAMHDASVSTKGVVAEAAGFFEKLRVIGTSWMGMAGLGGKVDPAMFGIAIQKNPNQEARAIDPNFDTKLTEAKKKLTDARFKAALAAMNEGDQIDTLLEKAKKEETFAKGSAQNDLQRVTAQTKGFELTAEANTKIESQSKRLEAVYVSLGQAQEKLTNANKSHEQSLKDLKAREVELMMALYDNANSGQSAAKIKENEIKLTKELVSVTNQEAAAVVKLQAPWNQIVKIVGDNLDQAFVDVFNGAGDGFKKLGQTIMQEIERIIVRLMIVKPLFSMTGTALGGGTGIFGMLGTAFTSYAGAMAGGGNISGGQFALVGENGPELLAKPGTVVSNDRIASAMGSGGKRGGDNYFIDMTGADAGKVEQLFQYIRSVDGSIVKRAVAGVIAAKRAGGGTGAALA